MARCPRGQRPLKLHARQARTSLAPSLSRHCPTPHSCASIPGAMSDPLLLYGATGYTGNLVAREARRQGLMPVLCGRNEGKLRALATDLQLEFRVAELADPRLIDRALEGIGVVLNAAGPFSSTAPPLLDACLRAGAHYLDVTGEVAVIDMTSRRGA